MISKHNFFKNHDSVSEKERLSISIFDIYKDTPIEDVLKEVKEIYYKHFKD